MSDVKVTINDIARMAGVSKRTVSRVINNSDKVGKKTKELIDKIIAETGFVPDKQARGLASSRSYLLGLVYDNPDALYIDEVQRGVLDYCSNGGYELVVHPCSYKSEDLIANVLSFVKRSKLDGIVILPPASEIDELGATLDDNNIPYIRIVSGRSENAENFVVSNDGQAVFELVDFLITLNHEKIAMITGPMNYRSSKERFSGYKVATEKAKLNLPQNYVVEGTNQYISGIECANVLLDLPERPSAIIANNDEMAAGALKVAVAKGIKVPEELSICGFDDNLLASRIMPQLTTARRPVRQMAKAAAKKLIAKIENGNPSVIVEEVVVAPKVVIRESTAALSPKT
ncbi:LacI family transcriptional regulator (plasmid) [Saccharobesus litoralis]|uniref:LacI family transcriptional regulator n=1 Tax=Saccharobesus litoralis TaxID=2172099 RepID=A0A2S0VYJ6_9ALTE|nr:LacI family DNA-binding transcriptional regulator [Saccharobesus litoralis]AWB69220.1 LacI family transcriptional regulator [Saccharobesus litoralis]